MIVFTIYKNGGNAGVLGASFSCAVFGVCGSSCGNNGALLTAGRAKDAFKSTDGLSVCVSTVSVQSVLGRLRFASARIRSVRELGRKNVRRFIWRALFNGGGIVHFDASSSVSVCAFAARIMSRCTE